MRAFRLVAGAVALLAILVVAGNWAAFDRRVQADLDADARNSGIRLAAYLAWGMNPNSLVLDLRDISGGKSMADVDRVLLTALQSLKSNNFDRVALAHRGSHKFQMNGSYAKQLGEEYGFQNPVYTMRTMQENIYRLDGSPAFGTWTGGWLGVMGKQMEDHQSFHRQWYLSEL